jgi:hypothetical protein
MARIAQKTLRRACERTRRTTNEPGETTIEPKNPTNEPDTRVTNRAHGLSHPAQILRSIGAAIVPRSGACREVSARASTIGRMNPRAD